MSEIKSITAADFTALMRDNPDLNILDIRTDLEMGALSLIQEVNHHPMHKINPDDFVKSDKPTYILCKMGPRAFTVAEALSAQGHKDLIVIDGGIMGCAQSGAPLNQSDAPPRTQEIMQAVQSSFQRFMMDNN